MPLQVDETTTTAAGQKRGLASLYLNASNTEQRKTYAYSQYSDRQ